MASILILSMAIFWMGDAYCKDLGNYGKCYEIAEEDLKEHLMNRIEKIPADERALIVKRLNDRYEQSLSRPKSYKNPKKASTYKIRYFDPSICAQKTIKDHEGNIIVLAGETYNPLDHVSLKEPLLFFDAEDIEQLKWAKSHPAPNSWILVKGKPLDLEREEDRPVFFDQEASLSRHFELKNFPSRISQEGKKLIIEEIYL